MRSIQKPATAIRGGSGPINSEFLKASVTLPTRDESEYRSDGQVACCYFSGQRSGCSAFGSATRFRTRGKSDRAKNSLVLDLVHDAYLYCAGKRDPSITSSKKFQLRDALQATPRARALGWGEGHDGSGRGRPVLALGLGQA